MIRTSGLTCFTALMLATVGAVRADNPAQSAPNSNEAANAGSDQAASRPNLLIIAASSLNSPVPQTQLLSAMLESNGTPMNVEGAYSKLDAVKEILGSQRVLDYVLIDAWHLGRTAADFGQGRTSVPTNFSKAVAVFVKQVHTHSTNCKFILYPWYIPSGPKATNEGGMEIFLACVEQAKANDLWVATIGPAFMEARLDHPDLTITKSETDSHPGKHGAYLIACSLFAVLTDKSPVGLSSTLQIGTSGETKENFQITPADAKAHQDLAWKIHEREAKNVKPTK